MTKFRSIFWHRRDLRIEDNIGLSEASKNSKNLIGIYVLDPILLNLNRTTSEAKNWFLAESLLELQKNWESKGSRLLILNGDPLKLISKLAELIKGANFFVALDSVASHIGAAVGTKGVTLFGPSKPENWRPWAKNISIISRNNCKSQKK